MLIGALVAFVPAVFGFALLETWRRSQARQYEQAEVRSLRSRQAWEAWEAVDEVDTRRAA
jgi:hypothetical protein